MAVLLYFAKPCLVHYLYLLCYSLPANLWGRKSAINYSNFTEGSISSGKLGGLESSHNQLSIEWTKKSPKPKPLASALGFYKDWVPIWITGQCDCQHTTKKTSLPTRTSSQLVHFSWEWNLPSPPVCWLHGGARPSWPGAQDVGASSGGARGNWTDCQLWCLHLSQQEVESRTCWQ